MTERSKIIWHTVLVIVPIILIYLLTLYVTNEFNISLWAKNTKSAHVLIYLFIQLGHMIIYDIKNNN